MTTTAPEISPALNEKNVEVEHVELKTDAHRGAEDLPGGVALVKSRFDTLSVPRTLWVFRRAVLVCIAVYTGYVCEGFELNAGGTVIANAGFIKQFGTGATGVTALDPTWVSSWSALLNVGQMVVQTHVALLADRYGRKASFYYAWVWLFAGCMFLNFAKSPSVWALGKLCNGAGIGVIQVTCQVYVMEICPDRIRGGMVVFQQVWSGIGGIVVAVMMQQLNQTQPDNYILPMRILWAPIGIMLLCWALVPESPWFHARRGDREGAMKSLKQLYGNVKGYDYDEEYSIIERTIAHERATLDHAPRYRDVFMGLNLRRTLSVMILAVAQQFAGLTIISTYSTYFFSLAGLADPFLGTVILSCVNLLAILLWSMSADTLGRRTIVCTCETLVVVILFIVGGLNYTGATSGNVAAGNGLLVICCFWTFFYQTVGMSYYLYSTELPSALLRVRTGPITFLSNSITGVAACYATPPLLLNLSLRAGFVYGAFSVPMCIIMWLYIPETMNRSAAEIDELYERKIPAWRWKKTVTLAEEQMHAAVEAREEKAV